MMRRERERALAKTRIYHVMTGGENVGNVLSYPAQVDVEIRPKGPEG